MDSIIETQRSAHEEIERYEQALAEVLLQNPTAQKNITRRDRKAAEILGRVGGLRKELVDFYEDLPGLRPKELELLSAPPPGEDDLAEFYVRYNKIKDFHQRNPGISSRQFITQVDELVKGDGVQSFTVEGDEEPTIIDPLDSVFSGEESHGKYLDLYLNHSQYMNLRGATRLSYLAYLEMLKSGKVERTLDLKEKTTQGYLEYVQTLYNYLLSFFERALPLVNVQAKLAEEEEEFKKDWADGKVAGWEAESSSNAKKAQGNGTGEGIWCQYCQKSYSKQTVYDAHLNSEKHKKKEQAAKSSDSSQTNGSPAPNPNPSASTSTYKNKLEQPARLTYLISALLTFPPIPEKLTDTRSETERKMALTARERETELEEQEEAPPVPVDLENNEEDEDEDGKIYNPLKLPLGFKANIRFFHTLYKLHGLGVTFECEVCQSTYQGRRAYDKHWQEAKHMYGLRALGIPQNGAFHFRGISTIADVLALADKLKREGRQSIAEAEKAEEMEDDEGNVYDRKTYFDLKKQGLL
uniref:Splicing factor 3A subunit 3 n=1 Tax=Kwoniella bestiolae CBS 10118 TaxID=1296100 RepID=A0A1B9GE46_9TREE|nr:splicing factor 3A subunit 3 [Kwoniella bestiolae CBS 10118]OCF29323.1 splicing factor 3A subunit 3 [Kwoniella bestiolae CBS 10118]